MPGLTLDHRYRLTRRIAIGGMGEVWAATDRTLGRSVAVKVLRPELMSDPEFVGRFRAEAQITASLNNPGIAAVYDYGEAASSPGGPTDVAYLVMELVGGDSLAALLAQTPRMHPDAVLDILEQCGRALEEAHSRGLVHRDIKPGNILLPPSGRVKLTDFGIAKVASNVSITRGGMVMGTAQYLAPEQAAGDPAVPASDVYALGVVGYECLAGYRPFVGDNPVIVAMAHIRNEPPPLPPDVPPTVAALIRATMHKSACRPPPVRRRIRHRGGGCSRRSGTPENDGDPRSAEASHRGRRAPGPADSASGDDRGNRTVLRCVLDEGPDLNGRRSAGPRI